MGLLTFADQSLHYLITDEYLKLKFFFLLVNKDSVIEIL